MPVWHARTKALREAGELEVCGIVQEQHRERAELYAQWQGLDWPILWDPFNLTGAEVVLNAYLVRPDGVIWKARATPDDLEAFLELEWPDVGSTEASELADPRLSTLDGREIAAGYWPSWPNFTAKDTEAWALTHMLWPYGEGQLRFKALEYLRSEVVSRVGPEQKFRRGVAFRMLADLGGEPTRWRKQSAHGDPPGWEPVFDRSCFELAARSWAAALDARPSQYVWRRRLQQYGPQLDKPYPFYDWVETARAELRARGEEPVALRVALTPTETLGRDVVEAAATREPDPEAKLPRDEGWFDVDATFVHDTQGRMRACAHLSFTPRAAEEATWNDEAGPLVVWIEGPDALRLELAPGGEPTRRRTVSFDLTPTPGAKLTGYAVLQVCEHGVCRTVRHDFSFDVPAR